MKNAKHLPTKAVAERYGVDIRTIGRWIVDETLGFPKPTVINGRNYYREDELDEFDRHCARRVAAKAA